MDLWVAPLITGVHALLTHSQQSWVPYHNHLVQRVGSPTMFGSFEYAVGNEGPAVAAVKPMGEADARSICALVLCALFAYRSIINFGIDWSRASADVQTKRKRIIRSSEFLTASVDKNPNEALLEHDGKRLSKENIKVSH